RPRTLGAHECVVQLDRLKHRAQLVVAVGTDAEHAQIQIHLRVRTHGERDGTLHVVEDDLPVSPSGPALRSSSIVSGVASAGTCCWNVCGSSDGLTSSSERRNTMSAVVPFAPARRLTTVGRPF